MARLTADQVYALARQAGFDPQAAVIATAIARGESGWNARAHNPNAGTGDNSYGLMQINMIGNLGPARLRQFGISSNEALWDPLTNMRAAYIVSGGGKNWRPWTVYTKGVYSQYLGEATAAAQRVGENVGDLVAQATQAAGSGGGGGAPLTKEQLAQRVRDQYPGYAWLLMEPEIANLLLEAVDPNKGFDEATLRARLYNTQWWKSHSEAMRTWDTLYMTDPAEAESRIQETGELVQQRARVLGVEISFQTAREIASASLRFGWTGDFAASKIDRMLIDRYAHTGAGLIGSTEDEIRALARSFLIRLTDTEAKDLAVKVTRGDDTIDGLRARFSDQAKALFPQVAGAIDAGSTVADFVAPYQRIAAEMLEVAPDAIDFTDSKYLVALNGGENRTPLSLSDWQKKIRTDSTYGWGKTKQARDQAWGVAADLLRSFGAIR